MNEQFLLLACLLIPLAGLPLILLSAKQPNLRETFSLLTAVLLFVCTVTLYNIHQDGKAVDIILWSVLPGLELHFRVEALGLIFCLLASFLWIITTIYAIGYMRAHDEQHQTRFYAFFAIAIAATMGIALSANLFTLFIFYEVLTLSTYPLVTHAGTDKARQGGRVYLGILISTSIALLLLAMIWTWQISGSLQFTPGGILPADTPDTVKAILLCLFVFGTGKAAIMPIHRWLPSAMVAPTPVSALLHAVAVVKAGVFTILKIVVFIFGIDTVQKIASSQWLIMLACITILLASLVAMRKDNLKARLAYSTISQLSYIVLAALLASQMSIIAGSMHMVMHAFGKITLFFCAGAIYVTLHKTEVSQLDGMGRRMPLTMLAFFIGSLSIIGLPPTGGTWSKWYLALSTVESGYLYALVVLMLSSLLNVAYLLAIPVRAFFKPARDSEIGYCEAPAPILLALAITVSGSLLLFIFPESLLQLAKQVATGVSL